MDPERARARCVGSRWVRAEAQRPTWLCRTTRTPGLCLPLHFSTLASWELQARIMCAQKRRRGGARGSPWARDWSKDAFGRELGRGCLRLDPQGALAAYRSPEPSQAVGMGVGVGGRDGERRPERRGRALALRRDIRFLGSGRRIAQRLSCGILALRSGSWVGVSQLSSRGPSTNQARRWRPGIVARYPGQGPLRSTPPRATPKRLLLGQGRGGSHPGLLGQTPLWKGIYPI